MHEESHCRDLNDRLKSLAQKHQADSTEANRLRYQNKFDSRNGVVNLVSGNEEAWYVLIFYCPFL